LNSGTSPRDGSSGTDEESGIAGDAAELGPLMYLKIELVP